jgi:hypothetical protein
MTSRRQASMVTSQEVFYRLFYKPIVLYVTYVSMMSSSHWQSSAECSWFAYLTFLLIRLFEDDMVSRCYDVPHDWIRSVGSFYQWSEDLHHLLPCVELRSVERWSLKTSSWRYWNLQLDMVKLQPILRYIRLPPRYIHTVRILEMAPCSQFPTHQRVLTRGWWWVA